MTKTFKIAIEKALTDYIHHKLDKPEATNSIPSRSISKSSLVCDLHPHDVILGRGEGISKQSGNVLFRQLVTPRRKMFYLREERNKVAQEIIDEINKLDPPGRFLMISPVDFSSLYEISHKKAITKVCQSLRDQSEEKKRILSKNCKRRICNDILTSKPISKQQISSQQEASGHLNKNQVTHSERHLPYCNDNTKQQVIMPLSYIGQAFLKTSDRCTDESKEIFKMLADLPNQDESALLHLPSIVGSLCRHISELERRSNDLKECKNS